MIQSVANHDTGRIHQESIAKLVNADWGYILKEPDDQ